MHSADPVELNLALKSPVGEWSCNNTYIHTYNFYPRRNGSIGTYGPDTIWIKVHCFFAKTAGIVSVFVGSVPFLLCRVNATLIDVSFYQKLPVN